MSDLAVLGGRYAVCRLAVDAPIPAWTAASPFVSITRTAEELSIVCAEGLVPPDTHCEPGWRILRVAGPLAFSLTGVLAAIAAPLANAAVSLFAVSTFDTDYVLVKESDLANAVDALRLAGHSVGT